MVRMYINIGRNKKIQPGDVVRSIASKTSMSGSNIGQIDINDDYTFVDIPKKYAEEVLDIMRKGSIKGNKIIIEKAQGKRSKGRARR